MAAAAVSRAAAAAEHWPPPVHHVVLDLDVVASSYTEGEVPQKASSEGERPAAPPVSSGPKIPELVVARKALDPLERQIDDDIKRFEEMPPKSGRPPCIWRVHPSLREQEREAYEPRIVSIGPLHRGNERLRPMEEIKLRYLNDLLRRRPENRLSDYIRVVRGCEQRAREQYAEDTAGMNRDEFVRMLVVDGCFIIEYLLKMVTKETQLLQLCGARLCSSYMRRDLMLLENQVPFFVLVNLFRQFTAAVVDRPRSDLVAICLEFLAVELPKGVVLPEGDVCHLLHLYHMCLNPKRMPDDQPPSSSCGRALCLPVKLARRLISAALFGLLYLLLLRKCPFSCSPAATAAAEEDGGPPAAIPCATELQLAGVKFRKRKGVGCCFLKVRFVAREGKLLIPLLSVNESTGSLFRNLIALEQSCAPDIVDSHMTAYAFLLDNIVNTAGDVGILRERGIIESKLGSDKDVAKMINTLCNGTHLLVYKGGGEDLYADLFRDVSRYCAVPHHKWRASLKQTYFTSPWTAISLLVGILLFCVAVTQVCLNIRRHMRK